MTDANETPPELTAAVEVDEAGDPVDELEGVDHNHELETDDDAKPLTAEDAPAAPEAGEVEV